MIAMSAALAAEGTLPGDEMINALFSTLERMGEDQRGATAVEYGIMVALIAIVIIGAVFILGETLTETYDCAATAIGGMPVVDECAE